MRAILIAAKELAFAKNRLASVLPPAERKILAEAMFRDVLAAALSARNADCVAVVTSDRGLLSVAREGGAFSSRMEAKDGSMGFDFAGIYTKIIEHRLIEYSFGDRTAQVAFTPEPTGVGVRVTFDSETTHAIGQQRDGWQAILNNFARHVESKRKV